MNQSEGLHELQAARKHLSAAKEQRTSTAKNMNTAKAMLEVAERNLEQAKAMLEAAHKNAHKNMHHARSMDDAAANEVDEAEKNPRQAEKRWEAEGKDRK